MKLPIGHGARRGWNVGVAESTQVSLHAIELRVAQHLTTIVTIEPARAVTERESYHAGFEEFLQLERYTEDTDHFVLIDVVQVGHCANAFRRDHFIVRLDGWRDAHFAESG